MTEQAQIPVVSFDLVDGCFIPILTLGLPVILVVRTTAIKEG